MNYRKSLLVCLILSTLVLPATAHGQSSCRAFPETGHQICGRLLEYWAQNGGLPVFGYPIGEQVSQTIEGKQIELLSFERNRLELHPENARPYDVLLGRLGVDTLQRTGRDWKKFGKVSPSTPHYFAQTGHAIAPPFWGYWSGHGLEFDRQAGTSFEESLALFGLPLSEATVEVNPTDGKPYLTQWFERAFRVAPRICRHALRSAAGAVERRAVRRRICAGAARSAGASDRSSQPGARRCRLPRAGSKRRADADRTGAQPGYGCP
jgi:hypothetical protein